MSQESTPEVLSDKAYIAKLRRERQARNALRSPQCPLTLTDKILDKPHITKAELAHLKRHEADQLKWQKAKDLQLTKEDEARARGEITWTRAGKPATLSPEEVAENRRCDDAAKSVRIWRGEHPDHVCVMANDLQYQVVPRTPETEAKMVTSKPDAEMKRMLQGRIGLGNPKPKLKFFKSLAEFEIDTKPLIEFD